MTADFGTLRHDTLELHPGLNIIEAPNEFGKTTWCAFIRAMLYGVDTSQRSRGGRKPDKTLYAPWSGEPMAGTMEVTFQGREITLRRATESPAAPMRRFTAVYSGTNTPVGELTHSDAGETLTGMPLSVFRRTVFIGPGGLGVDQSPELEKKIASLASAGEENSSFSEARSRLQSAQRRLRSRGQGVLAEQEAETARLRERLSALSAGTQELEKIEVEIEALTARKERVSGLNTPEGALARRRAETMALQWQADRREQEADAVWTALRRGLLRGEEPDEERRKKVEKDARRARELSSQTKKRSPLPWIGCLAAAAVLAILGFWQRPFFLPAGLALALGAGLALLWADSRKKAALIDRALSKILSRYGVQRAEEIPDVFESYLRQWREAVALSDASEALRARAREMAENETPRSDSGAPPEAELHRLREAAERVRGRMDALGDSPVLESQLAWLEAEHRQSVRRSEALSLAVQELTQADEEMRARFAPALSRETGEILRRLTGGRYAEVQMDRDLSSAVRRTSDLLPREEGYLSRGTLDQVYLALRLALCERLPMGEEPCPLILDDALIAFDDERMGYALDYLQELSEYRQILLFTCHSRERRYLAEKKQ